MSDHDNNNDDETEAQAWGVALSLESAARARLEDELVGARSERDEAQRKLDEYRAGSVRAMRQDLESEQGERDNLIERLLSESSMRLDARNEAVAELEAMRQGTGEELTRVKAERDRAVRDRAEKQKQVEYHIREKQAMKAGSTRLIQERNDLEHALKQSQEARGVAQQAAREYEQDYYKTIEARNAAQRERDAALKEMRDYLPPRGCRGPSVSEHVELQNAHAKLREQHSALTYVCERAESNLTISRRDLAAMDKALNAELKQRTSGATFIAIDNIKRERDEIKEHADRLRKDYYQVIEDRNTYHEDARVAKLEVERLTLVVKSRENARVHVHASLLEARAELAHAIKDNRALRVQLSSLSLTARQELERDLVNLRTDFDGLHRQFDKSEDDLKRARERRNAAIKEADIRDRDHMKELDRLQAVAADRRREHDRETSDLRTRIHKAEAALQGRGL